MNSTGVSLHHAAPLRHQGRAGGALRHGRSVPRTEKRAGADGRAVHDVGGLDLGAIGVGFAVGLGEQWDLDIGYRYFVADGAEGEATDTFIGSTTVVTPYTTDADYEHQALTVGLRYQFAAPAPPETTARWSVRPDHARCC